jgi:hypothetical protein
MFNSPITREEIVIAVHDLKKGKSAGCDKLIAEMFVFGAEYFIDYMLKLFNTIFDTGYFPSEWSRGTIVPIHKGGAVDNADNYRGITLLSIFSKVYISILNKRITKWVTDNTILNESQAGFRKGYTTTDNIFTLCAIIQKYISKKKCKIYVAFVDFKKAFDSVDRNKLLLVLRKSGLYGKLLTSIESMYKVFRSCVKTNEGLTDFFDCPMGVRQGCILSPMLFSLFINELDTVISSSCGRGIQMTPDLLELFLLLFADDVVLFSDSVWGLQNQLNILQEYCNNWKMSVNMSKTKIIVFRRGGRLSQFEKWTYGGKQLEVVSKYNYLGFTLTSNLSFNQTCVHLSIKAKRALYEVLKTMFQYGNFPYHVFFRIFDTQIMPILLHGAEVWGFQRFECIERIQYMACKRFLNISKHTPNVMVLGECGRNTLYYNTVIKCITFWVKLIHMPTYRYPRKAYDMLYVLDCAQRQTWATSIKNVLFNFGFGYAWIFQEIGNVEAFICEFKQRVKDVLTQEWLSSLHTSSRFDLYSLFKFTLTPEMYITDPSFVLYRRLLTKIRIGMANLAVEQGRYTGIARHLRFCIVCNTQQIEDEYHFIMICPIYHNLRTLYLPANIIIQRSHRSFATLMSSGNKNVILNLQLFIHYALSLKHDILSANVH